jgi:hypothetical protein
MPKDKSAARERMPERKGESLTMTKAELIRMFGGQATMVQRMLEASRGGQDVWLKLVGNRLGKGGARTIIDRASAWRAYERLLAGEVPPLMRSEQRRHGRGKKPVQHLRQPSGLPTKSGLALMQAFDLLPKDAAQIVFYPRQKQFALWWTNGNYDCCRIHSARGQRRRITCVPFQPSKNTPLPRAAEQEEP